MNGGTFPPVGTPQNPKEESPTRTAEAATAPGSGSGNGSSRKPADRTGIMLTAGHFPLGRAIG